MKLRNDIVVIHLINDKAYCQQVSGTDTVPRYCLALADVLFQNVQVALKLILTHMQERIMFFLNR